jgi:hypothetical protein
VVDDGPQPINLDECKRDDECKRILIVVAKEIKKGKQNTSEGNSGMAEKGGKKNETASAAGSCDDLVIQYCTTKKYGGTAEECAHSDNSYFHARYEDALRGLSERRDAIESFSKFLSNVSNSRADGLSDKGAHISALRCQVAVLENIGNVGASKSVASSPLGKKADTPSYDPDSHANTDPVDTTKTRAPVTQCVTDVREGKYSMLLKNSCSFPIRTMYCFTDAKDISPYYDVSESLCSSYSKTSGIGTSGGVYIDAGSSVSVNAPGNISKVSNFACQVSDSLGLGPSDVTWNGSRLVGKCPVGDEGAGGSVGTSPSQGIR